MDRKDQHTAVTALRLGLDPQQVQSFSTPLTQHPETLLISDQLQGEQPLLILLHPPRLTEYQFAQKVRGLTALHAHLAFPRGIHAHLVDLGGARTVGFDWLHYIGDNPSFRANLRLASEHLDKVVAQILEALDVDRRSIYLLGAEGAALFTSIYGVARSDTFAGLITIGGTLLPEIINTFAPEKRRLPFLCINRRRGRGRFADDGSGRIDDLRGHGFPVAHEVLRGDHPPWHEELALTLSWLSQKAGIAITQPEGEQA